MAGDANNGSAKAADRAGSLDVVFEQVKARLATQDAQISALDGKANFSLASATLLTAGVTALQGAFSSAREAGRAEDVAILGGVLQIATAVNVLSILALAAYVAVVISAYQAYKTREYSVIARPGPLRDKYLNKPESETKEALIHAAVEVYSRNERLVTDKIKWTDRVLLALVTEGFLLLLITVVQLAL